MFYYLNYKTRMKYNIQNENFITLEYYDVVGVPSVQLEVDILLNRCEDELFCIENCVISFIRRQTNWVAHHLARTTQFHVSHQVYDQIFTYIATYMINEMTFT